MLKILRNRMRDEKGFTLIELMVVVLIIAILLAIAIPTFLGLRTRAQDRAAQSDLRNGLVAAKAFYTDGETYTGFTDVVAEGIEPSLEWRTTLVTGEGLVTIDDATTGNTGRLLTVSESGVWFCIQDAAGVNGYGNGADRVAAEADCASASW